MLTINDKLRKIWAAMLDARIIHSGSITLKTGLHGLEVRTTILELYDEGYLVPVKTQAVEHVGNVHVWRLNERKVADMNRRLAGRRRLSLVASEGKVLE